MINRDINSMMTLDIAIPGQSNEHGYVLWAAFLIGLLLAFPAMGEDEPRRVGDINPGVDSSSPESLTTVGDTLFFVADDGVNGRRLWRSNGSTMGTMMVRPGIDVPDALTPVGDMLYFAASDLVANITGRELWKTHSVGGSATLVKDIQPGNLSSNPIGLTNVNGTLFFTAIGINTGRELWKSDGTPSGTVMVKDIISGEESPDFGSYPSAPNFTDVGKTLYFVADDKLHGRELWKSDGSTVGTVMVKDINPGSNTSHSMNFSYFAHVHNSASGMTVFDMLGIDDTLYFAADDGTNGRELWKTDGTANGTVMIKNIASGSGSADPNDFVELNGKLYFAATSFPGGRELWMSDGSSSGTQRVKDINLGGSSAPSWLSNIDGTLYFQADDGAHGAEFWKSDGTEAGTVLVKDISLTSSSSPGESTGRKGLVYFSANNGVIGEELWRTDGTPGLATPAGDINPGPDGSNPWNRLKTVGDILFFQANDGITGAELWAVGGKPGPEGKSAANFIHSGTSEDPVNTFTGELFSQKSKDLDLGGPMPLYFQRYYASYLRRDFVLSDLGSNWRHNFDARLYWVGTTMDYVDHKGRVTKFAQDQGTEDWDQLTNSDTPYQLSVTLGEDVQLYDPIAKRIYTFDYTTDNIIAGKLSRIEDGKGNVHTLNYQLATGHLDTVEDGLGRSLSFFYNSNILPKISVVSDGTRAINFEYLDSVDSEYLTLYRDADGGVTTYTYADTSGNADHGLMTSMRRPENNVPYTQTYYDISDPLLSGRVETQIDSNGNTFTFDYAGSDTIIIDPLFNTRVHTHTASGEFSNRQDQAGQSFAMGSDSTGRRNSITDRLGDTTSYDYHTPSGKISSVTGADATLTSYDYATRILGDFTFNDLTTVTQADGETEGMVYDAFGNLISHKDEAGDIATFTYDSNGQVLTTTNPDLGVVVNTYNADGTQDTQTDAEGNTTTFSYDLLKRLNLITYDDGSSKSFTYDNRDNVLSTTDENGHVTQMAYDANGNLEKIIDPLTYFTTFTYDGNDRLLSMADYLGDTTTLSYDHFGRVKTATDENGNVTIYGYDILGRLTSTTDPLGHISVSTYDIEAIPVSSTDPLGNTTSYDSDKKGRITRIISPLGNTSRVAYDTMGRVISNTDPLGYTTLLDLDARGLVTSETLLSSTISASYTRDVLGNITQVTDPNSHNWLSSYDSSGRLTGSTDPLGNQIAIDYDNRNRPDLITYPASLGTQTISYDPAGNLTDRDYLGGPNLDFTYDAADRLTSANGITLGYDANGRIVDSNGITITRDPGGRIATIALAPLKNVSYDYDANNRLTRITGPSGEVTNFSYDAVGQMTEIDRPNGISTSYSYDSDGRLVGINEGAISNISLTRDADGQILSASRRLPQAALSSGVSEYSNSYDAASQQTGASYDAMGRLTGRGADDFSWDLASRLTEYTISGSSITASYDALGYKLSRTEGGNVDEFVWNRALDLHSISVLRRDGSDLRYYIHTPAGELIYSIDAVSGINRYYHFDEMGNTVFVTSDAGTVIGSYSYTPYGEVVASNGGLDNLFTWQGRVGVMDEGNGLYYMRARHYESTTARFMSRDPKKSIKSLKINPYQYALENPLKYSDPLGLDVLPEDVEYHAEWVLALSGAGVVILEGTAATLGSGVVALAGVSFWTGRQLGRVANETVELGKVVGDLLWAWEKEERQNKFTQRIKEEAKRNKVEADRKAAFLEQQKIIDKKYKEQLQRWKEQERAWEEKQREPRIFRLISDREANRLHGIGGPAPVSLPMELLPH